MRSVRSIRFLTVVSLAFFLLVAPIVTHAAPRLEPNDESSWLATSWDWVSSLWGAGGGGWDPTSVKSTAPVANAPIAPVSGDARSAAQPEAETSPRRR